MIFALRLMVCLLLVEAALCLWLTARQLLRPVPFLPAVELADPMIMQDLQDLAKRAEGGTSADWTALGEGLLGQGFYAHAVPVFRQALTLDPDNMPAQFGVAFCLDRTGQLEASSAEYRNVLKLKPRSPADEMLSVWAFYALGRNALREENPEEAERFFSNQSGYAAADYQTAQLRLRSGRIEEALPIIEHGLSELPFSLEFHLLKQRAMTESQRPRDAFYEEAMIDRSAYLVSTNFNTEYVEPLRMQVGMNVPLEKVDKLLASGKLDEAAVQIEKMTSLIEDQPTMQIHYLNIQSLKVALLRQQPDKVFALLKQMRADGRNDEVMLEIEGDAWKLKGDTDQAAAAWNRALLLAPSISLHSKLAEYYDQADPDQAQIHRSRIQLLTGIQKYRSNQLEAALVPLKLAASLNPADPDPWFYLGEMNFHLDLPAAAISAYEECLKQAPAHGRAAARLEYLRAANAG